MIVPSIVRRKFIDWGPHLTLLKDRVKSTVSAFCEEQGFAYVGRLKSLESLTEKLESGRFPTWASLDDLFGCIVVIPTLEHEPAVLSHLNKVFVPQQIRARGSTRKQPDAFRFDATRFIGRLIPTHPSDASSPLFTTNFEIQVRTAFEHAWSVTTWALAYKTQNIDWKSLRLAAQLKAAVEQLDTLVLAYAAAAEPIIEHEWPELTAKQMIVSRFSDLSKNGLIAQEMQPKDWSRFAENLYSLLRNGSRTSRQDMVSKALDCIEAEVMKLGKDGVPMSVSLLQFSIGVLARSNEIGPSLKEYVPLITEELEGFYPETREFAVRFQFEPIRART